MPKRYIPFEAVPIQVQATLNNFTRTRLLKYSGNDKVENFLLKGLPFLCFLILHLAPRFLFFALASVVG